MASAVVLNSSDYGYASDAYKNVAVELSRGEVLEAYASGRAIERRGATVKFDGNSGEVLVAFSPELCRKNIMVELEGIAASDNKAAVMCELSLGDISLSPGTFQLEGERITQFESAVNSDRKWLLKHLRLKPASAYRIVDAALSGDTLRIVLAPLSVAVPNGGKWLNPALPYSAYWCLFLPSGLKSPARWRYGRRLPGITRNVCVYAPITILRWCLSRMTMCGWRG